MADTDIKMSELPVLPLVEIKDEALVTVVQDDLNYIITVADLKSLSLDNLYANRPLGELSLTAISPSQTFDDTAYTVITAFDKIQFERGMTVDPATDSITITEDGNYQVSATIVGEFAKAESLDAAIMVDGVVAESFGNIQGLGTGKGTLLGGADIDPMTAGQVIQVAAKKGEAGSVDVVFPKVRLIVARV